MNVTKQVWKMLGHYVYALVDPRNNQVFYVGKGQYSRAMNHLKPIQGHTEGAKLGRIKEIADLGLKVRIDIIRYGLRDEDEALEVEAAVIDAIGIQNLTNEIRGQRTERGRVFLDDFTRHHSATPHDLNDDERYVLFFITKSYYPGMNGAALYDAVRQFWHNYPVVARTPNAAGNYAYDTALAIVDGVVVAVYRIQQWHAAGTTPSTRIISNLMHRWEFTGTQMYNHPLIGKAVHYRGEPIVATQVGYKMIPQLSSLKASKKVQGTTKPKNTKH